MRIIKIKNLRESFFKSQIECNMSIVHRVINEVRKYGDQAVNKYTKKFDKVSLTDFRVRSAEIKNAYENMNERLKVALKQAKKNIEKFSRAQLKQLKNFQIQIVEGVVASQIVIPLERIGIYVPGGRFPLVSTVLMCGVPAIVAGVKEIALCSPPLYNNTIHPSILAAAKLVGIKEIYKIGGIQAIAALAYGTETIKPVVKIFGPGNVYVANAKKIVSGDVGIDFIAGPTEILIIADDSAAPEIIAADLLAQAEHDMNAIPILITPSLVLAKKVKKEIARQIKFLKTKMIAQSSITNQGVIIITENLDQAIEIANRKAPEHLELQVRNPGKYINRLRNYGSLFLGKYSGEAFGDYTSGLNHTLPTSGAAKYTGGLHIKDFLKIQTILKINKNGLRNLGPVTQIIADEEGLYGHSHSIKIRMESSDP